MKKEEELFSTDEALVFKYKNWEGEVAVRRVRPIKIWFGTTEWHQGNHWFLKAHDLEKDAERDFDLADIIEIYPAKQPSKQEKVL